MRRWICGLACLLASVTGVNAWAARPRIITQPDWVERPQAEDLAQAYPELANFLGIEGTARLACAVDSFGKLERCKVQNVSPESIGFEAAALGLTPLFRMKPMTVDGAPADGGQIVIPIAFRLPPLPTGDLTKVDETPALRLARRFVGASGLSGLVEAGFAKTADELEFLDQDGIAAEVRGDGAAAIRAAVKAHDGEIRERLAVVVASAFSEAELAPIVAAMTGPAGAFYRPNADREAILEMLERDVILRARAIAHESFCQRRDCDPAAALRVRVEAGLQAPAWTESPTQEEVDAARPAMAMNLALDGAARLRCIVGVRATLERCNVVAESPRGIGFGQSALSLAPRFRLDPRLMAQGAEGESLALTLLFSAAASGSTFEPPAARSDKALVLARRLVAYDPQATRSYAAAAQKAALEAAPPGADPAAYAEMLAAWSGGASQAADWKAEGVARTYAAIYPESVLAAAAEVGETPAFKLMGERLPKIEANLRELGEVMMGRISRTAHDTFCRTHACAVIAPPVSPPP